MSCNDALSDFPRRKFYTESECFRKGDARMTLFASSSNARTFDYQGGDIGYVPASFGKSVRVDSKNVKAYV